MLSRRDIEKELGKGINIYPLIQENFKENSINLTVSHNAWTIGNDTTIYWYGGASFGTDDKQGKKKTQTIRKGGNCAFQVGTKGSKESYVILLPHTTTLVETSEVLGVGNNIGGTLHSKVGVVTKGVGHIGTMLGPGYCGHLLVSLHNITDNVIALKVGTTFVSLALNYLTTQVSRTSSTVSGHVDKFAELGITIDEETRAYLTADWKSNISGVRTKMTETDSYKKYKKHIRQNAFSEIKKYINKKNIVAAILTLLTFLGIYALAQWRDKVTGQFIWVNRFWNVGCSGLVGTFLIGLFNFFKDKK